MKDTTYNGWTNYQTWVWKLWIDNEQSTYEYWREQVFDVIETAEIEFDFESIADARVRELAERLTFNMDSMAEEFMAGQSGPFADILNAGLGQINFREIAKSMLEDFEQ